MVDRSLNILHANAWDIGGGAAAVARNLSRVSRLRGHDTWLAVGRKYSTDPYVMQVPTNQELYGAWSAVWSNVLLPGENVSFGPASSIRKRISLAMAEPRRALDIVRGREDFNFPGTRHILELAGEQPDIIHCHNLHDAWFDLRELPAISHRVPTVVTLHDAWMLSGHCAHSLGCERWESGCGSCPDLSIPPAIRRDATRFNWQRKAAIYRNSKLFVAAPSRWLMGKVERSMLAGGIVEARVIPNGVDLSVFRPGNRAEARHALQIPQDARIVMYATNGITGNRWKDVETLRDAVARAAQALPNQRLLFLALGEDRPEERVGSAQVRYVPYQEDQEVVARFYQAADVYVHAARADTFPNTVIEAMACGLPVVATAVGGIPEQVDHGLTGFLVPPRDPAAFSRHLLQLLADDDMRFRMGVSGHTRATRDFDLTRQVDVYLDWYDEILERRGSIGEEAGRVAIARA